MVVDDLMDLLFVTVGKTGRRNSK